MKRERPESGRLPGRRCLWHILGSGIPCRVASQQSPTPFPRANSIFDIWLLAVKRIVLRFFPGKGTPCKTISCISRFWESRLPGKWRTWNCDWRKERSTCSWDTSRRLRGRARNVRRSALCTTTTRSGLGGTWTPANIAPSCTPRRRACVVPSMGSAWCACPGPSPTAASRRCSSVWRSTG